MVTVVRQGICAVCTTIQTYRILTLQSMIYAYTMSTLHLENLKTSDVQNTCIGIFGAYFFFQLSNSKPVKKLPTVKPETTIFNVPFWLSVIGQAVVLLTYMRLCMHYAKEYSLEEDLKVTNEEEFRPSFRGSMMFMFELISLFCISIFNHEGEPFMQSLRSKGKHSFMIFAPLAIVLLVCLDVSEDVNQLLQINLETKSEVEDVGWGDDLGKPVLLFAAGVHDGDSVRLDSIHKVPEVQGHIRLALISVQLELISNKKPNGIKGVSSGPNINYRMLGSRLLRGFAGPKARVFINAETKVICQGITGKQVGGSH